MQYGGASVSTEANRATLVAVFAGLAGRDGARFWEALSDDAVWTGPGDNDWAGPWRGKAEIREQLIRPLRARIGSPRSIADQIIVDGDWAAVQFHGDNETVDGERYDNRYVFILRFRDGLIVEVTEYMDTEMAMRVLGPRIDA